MLEAMRETSCESLTRDTGVSSFALCRAGQRGTRQKLSWLVLIIAAVIFLTGVISPPLLMDDVDASHATIARNMLWSGDWVTCTLDGVKYLDKAPLQFWMIAACYQVFGVHDWVARLPLALCTILLCWVTMRFGRWAFGEPAGSYAGLVLATCLGLFLFTRVLIPETILALLVTAAMWGMLRALDEQEEHPHRWSALAAACLGLTLLVKGLLGPVLLAGSSIIYLAITRQLFASRTYKRLAVGRGAVIAIAIAAPWCVLATLRNPPYFYWGLKSGPGQYFGFFWRFFINEHLLRFLNTRYPHDYNTVPRLLFWVLHLVWLFPWSVYLAAVVRDRFWARDADERNARRARVRLFALCWIGFLLLFFTFSTTQEYYTLPGYPAMALLLGAAIEKADRWTLWGQRVLGVVCLAAALVAIVILIAIGRVVTPGDITTALTSNPEAYTLSMGHLQDLTLRAMAYLRLPLLLAGVAMLLGGLASICWRGARAYWGTALMMVLFAEAAHLALVRFDPSLSSGALAREIDPKATLIIDDEYHSFSSVLFYAGRGSLDRPVFILHGRFNNLEYGSWAPGAPPVFVDENAFRRLWEAPIECYLLTSKSNLGRLKGILPGDRLHIHAQSGNTLLLRNN